MPLYMKMSENINETTRHFKFRYISFLQIFYGLTIYISMIFLYNLYQKECSI